MPVHLVVDLETCGNTTTAAIIELGAVVFDVEGPLKPLNLMLESSEKFYARVNLKSCLEAGLTVDGSTIAWWLRQNEAARLEASSAMESGVELRSALGSFGAWVRGVRPTRYWSHGASFDLPILDHAFRLVGYRAPWDFRSIRDTRTLFELAGVKYKSSDKDGHTALVDAWCEAKTIQEAYKALRKGE